MLKGKKIALGVAGGIAIFKVADLTSKLVQAGAEVRVVMTEAATKLITPITFKELSGNFVATDMWTGNQEFNVEHIALAQWAEALLIAPATANIIGKIAHGIADDMLSTVAIACRKPIIVCPAMNTGMYENPVVQGNIAALEQRGMIIMPPKAGHLACGTSGAGRLPEALEIRAFVDNFFSQQDGDLKGLKFLVTAAGTREAIDPVRFIGNRSSGKMGYAITQDILARGGQVVLVSGPSALTPPLGAEFVSVESTEQMLEAVLKYYAGVDVVIKAAAVADYKPHEVATQKIKKQATDDFTLKLDKNPDILKILGEKKTHQFLVGFAAETQHLLENAQAKLQKKNLDMIVANDVTAAGAGFNADTNIVKFLYPDGIVEEVPKMSKDAVGMALLDVVRSKLKDF